MHRQRAHLGKQRAADRAVVKVAVAGSKAIPHPPVNKYDEQSHGSAKAEHHPAGDAAALIHEDQEQHKQVEQHRGFFKIDGRGNDSRAYQHSGKRPPPEFFEHHRVGKRDIRQQRQKQPQQKVFDIAVDDYDLRNPLALHAELEAGRSAYQAQQREIADLDDIDQKQHAADKPNA